MLRWLVIAVLVALVTGVSGAGDDVAAAPTGAASTSADTSPNPLQLGRLDWDRPPAQGFTREVQLSIGEILRYPDDPWKERRLSLWNAPLGRTDFLMRQPGVAEPWREPIALSIGLPGGPLRFVDHGPLGDWYFNDPDPKTRAQLWTGFAIQTAWPLIDSLLH